MLKIRYSSKFKKDYKSIIKRGYNVKLLEEVLECLCSKTPLPEKYKDHLLVAIGVVTGNATSFLIGY